MDIWKAGPDVQKMLLDLIKKHHPRLLLVQDEIAVVFKEKASTPGGVTVFGKSSKAPPLLGALTQTDWKFVITLAADQWEHSLSETQRMALLDHHLCSMIVEEDGDQGTIKCSIKPPEGWYREEIERWGFWRPSCDPDAPTPVEQMFGVEKDEDDDGDGDGD